MRVTHTCIALILLHSTYVLSSRLNNVIHACVPSYAISSHAFGDHASHTIDAYASGVPHARCSPHTCVSLSQHTCNYIHGGQSASKNRHTLIRSHAHITYHTVLIWSSYAAHCAHSRALSHVYNHAYHIHRVIIYANHIMLSYSCGPSHVACHHKHAAHVKMPAETLRDGGASAKAWSRQWQVHIR